jgi:YfiH family protein
MNLGFLVGDAEQRVMANHQTLAEAARLPLARLFTVKQVHGNQVVGVEPKTHPLDVREADALFTEVAGAWLGVRAADCVPILLVDPDAPRVAAVHSGWRGTELRVVAKAVEALLARGSRAERLLAAVGPSIGPCCYEVSVELGARFTAAFGRSAVRRGPNGPHLDLPGAVAKTLRECGLLAQHIDSMQRCTACEPELFFSHRRDRGVTGRHLAYVACGSR